MEYRRTKIVCTIGPASSSVAMMSRMITAGMNVGRLNFSHGTHVEHKQLIKHIRAAATKTGKTIAILQDLQGPRIRMGLLPGEGVVLRKGERIILNTGEGAYKDGGSIPVDYKALHKDVKKGQRIFIDDGQMELEVISVRGKSVSCRVVVGGTLHSHKGINAPDSNISAPSFTKKDQEDALFGVKNEVDWIALSFVRSAKDIERVRDFLIRHQERGAKLPKLMAKIETRASVDAFESVLEAADGIMLARGDLGVEVHPAEVPIIQKEVTEICRQAGKPVVVATHMLDSMKHSVLPTRAEASDVANAVADHADALMLSQETAIGEYPEKSVKMMDVIIREAEAARLDDISFYQLHDINSIQSAFAQALHVMAENSQISAIVTSASYGEIARMINVFRPNVPMFVACRDAKAAASTVMHASVFPVVIEDTPGTFISRMLTRLRKEKKISSKEKIAFVTMVPNGDLQLTVTGIR